MSQQLAGVDSLAAVEVFSSSLPTGQSVANSTIQTKVLLSSFQRDGVLRKFWHKSWLNRTAVGKLPFLSHVGFNVCAVLRCFGGAWRCAWRWRGHVHVFLQCKQAV